MPTPKQKTSKSRRNARRSHHALKKLTFSLCTKCKNPILPHTLCMNCGTYRGNTYIDVLAKLSKRERKVKEKEFRKQEKESQKEAEAEKPLSMEELSKKS